MSLAGGGEAIPTSSSAAADEDGDPDGQGHCDSHNDEAETLALPPEDETPKMKNDAATKKPVSPSSSLGNQDEKICRFCFDDDTESPLISPCNCAGGQKYVHLECLRRWQRTVLVTQPTHPAFYDRDVRHMTCNVCKSEFTCAPPTRHELMQSFTGGEIAALIQEKSIIVSHESFNRELKREIESIPAFARQFLAAGHMHWINAVMLIVKVEEPSRSMTLPIPASKRALLGFLKLLEDDKGKPLLAQLDVPVGSWEPGIRGGLSSSDDDDSSSSDELDERLREGLNVARSDEGGPEEEIQVVQEPSPDPQMKREKWLKKDKDSKEKNGAKKGKESDQDVEMEDVDLDFDFDAHVVAAQVESDKAAIKRAKADLVSARQLDPDEQVDGEVEDDISALARTGEVEENALQERSEVGVPSAATTTVDGAPASSSSSSSTSAPLPSEVFKKIFNVTSPPSTSTTVDSPPLPFIRSGKETSSGAKPEPAIFVKRHLGNLRHKLESIQGVPVAQVDFAKLALAYLRPDVKQDALRSLEALMTLDEEVTCGEDHVVAVNLSRRMHDPQELMRATNPRSLLAAKKMTGPVAKIEKQLEKLSYKRAKECVEIEHYLGGPCDEDEIMACIALGGSGSGWTVFTGEDCLAEAVEAAYKRSVKRHAEEGEVYGGQIVRLQNLKACPELNGELGIALHFYPPSGRWLVRLANGEGKQLKPANLIPYVEEDDESRKENGAVDEQDHGPPGGGTSSSSSALSAAVNIALGNAHTTTPPAQLPGGDESASSAASSSDDDLDRDPPLAKKVKTSQGPGGAPEPVEGAPDSAGEGPDVARASSRPKRKPELQGNLKAVMFDRDRSARASTGSSAASQTKKSKTSAAGAALPTCKPKVFCIWGDARWSRTQLLGEIARGSWGLSHANVTDLAMSSVKRWKNTEGRLAFAPITEMSEDYMKNAERDMALARARIQMAAGGGGGAGAADAIENSDQEGSGGGSADGAAAVVSSPVDDRRRAELTGVNEERVVRPEEKWALGLFEAGTYSASCFPREEGSPVLGLRHGSEASTSSEH
eukprot:CAMPEP_0179000754 /NCGR_PEP_ID=MMETSP0795-20121207/10886_1 /TAXON_ID=88552 /ORGANISM="Amoebophrya sp., Strain Ameob2" /LENGTH=1054 /DNA_ID=CAMNT_0020693863 /DNA_START=607 /DNA_END=3770 /DNA_ORIENTATION=+